MQGPSAKHAISTPSVAPDFFCGPGGGTTGGLRFQRRRGRGAVVVRTICPT
jgi:hypothetical protein